MKKIFYKLNKIMFTAGMLALIILVLIAINSSDEVIDGVWGTISLLCLLVIFLFGIFVAISVVLAIIEGIKKDKRALFKKFLSNITWIAIAYIVTYVMDYFYESALPVNFEFGKIALWIMLTALAIMGGEYMVTDHNKEDKDELHF